MQKAEIALAVGMAAALTAVLVGCGGSGGRGSAQTLSPDFLFNYTRINALSTGFFIYSSDYDDTLPLKNWAEGVKIYHVADDDFHSPNVGSRGYGFAFNSVLVGKGLNQITNPLPLVFDSTDIKYSAVEPISTLPSPGRYKGTNMIAYTDGTNNDPITPQDYLGLGVSKIKQQVVSMLLYANDYDDKLAPGSKWMDSLHPYVRSDTVFQDAALPAGSYGYALRPEIPGSDLTTLPNQAKTIGSFNSTVTTKNALAETTTYPKPGRYNGWNVFNYLDGHAHSTK